MIFKLSVPAKSGEVATPVPLTGPRLNPHQLNRRSSIFVVATVLEVVALISIPAIVFPLKLLLFTNTLLVIIGARVPFN